MLPVDLVIVDDDQLTLDIITWNLRKEPVSFQLYATPSEALERLQVAMPMLLIVDNFMPVMDGVELLEALAPQRHAQQSAVYLCSAVRPPARVLDRLAPLGATALDKSVICNRQLLLTLISDTRNAAAPASVALPVE